MVLDIMGMELFVVHHWFPAVHFRLCRLYFEVEIAVVVVVDRIPRLEAATFL